jgi:hypothetical protein
LRRKGRKDTDHGTDGQLAKAVEEVASLTKALATAEESRKALAEELAKVKATPVPGGPMLTRVTATTAPDANDVCLAKARYYDEWADRVSDPSQADSYRQLAAQERAKVTPALTA